MITRDEALSLLEAHNATPSLLKHALASEAVLRALACKLNENPDVWSMAGLLHDLDFPLTADTPQLHGLKGAEMLERYLTAEACQAIRAHNGEMNGTTPVTMFDFGLRCGETVTGIIAAAALLRPEGYNGMTVKSIKKKMKDKAFAANVNREIIKECSRLGMELDEFLQLAIQAMSQLDTNRIEEKNGEM